MMLNRQVTTTLLLVGFACNSNYASAMRKAGVHSAVAHSAPWSLSPSDGPSCCCKVGRCEDGAMDDSHTYPAVYTPNTNLCCKLKKFCSRLFITGYTRSAPDSNYCMSPSNGGVHEVRYEPPNVTDEVVQHDEIKPGMPVHTIHNYCDLQAPGAQDGDDIELEESKATAQRHGKIVSAVVTELATNSLDSMAKEIFSMYVCVRWAPSPDFMRIAENEITTGQLPDHSSALEHYESLGFIPMRCSKNFNVYGSNPDLGETHYDTFEKEMQSIINWYDAEREGAFTARLAQLSGLQGSGLQAAASLFDVKVVKQAVAKCLAADDTILVSTHDSYPEDLLSDCAAAKWWLAKLQDWYSAMPFMSFMSPEAKKRKAAPKGQEQVLVCFGKRVASQLHRRDNGNHLLTDQSAVGCHGFWDMDAASKMLNRVVQLWRPPTCQLAAMELDMKVKLTELVAKMNSNLFDALPALLMEEMSGQDWDGKSLEADRGTGIVKGVYTSISNRFSSLTEGYKQLGQLLGDTVVKWAVCPLKAESDAEKVAALDAALGTEDDFAQRYATTAYAKWTGEKNLLPGEVCTEMEDMHLSFFFVYGRLKKCSLGNMRENMPEPYGDEEFICPTRPFLPAKEQLQVLKKKSSECIMRMSDDQMIEQSWLYRGHTPQKKQYDMMENPPSDQYRCDKILSTSKLPDTEFSIWRTFVTIGRGCTEQEARVTPRWCSAPEVANRKTLLHGLLNAGKAVGGAVGHAAVSGVEAAGWKNESQKNGAKTERLAGWFYGRVKGLEKYMKSSVDEWLGKAGERYDHLYARYFEEVEAAELLHSMSFQTKLDETGGDAKKLQKFDRFAVTCPCSGFNPEDEFELRYEWAENALAMARKASQKFAGILTDAGGFRVQLRGDAVLNYEGEDSAWMSFFTHITAAPVNQALPAWIVSLNPFLNEMAGTLGARTLSSSNFAGKDLNGFEALFTCGTRKELHDLPAKFTEMSGSFLKCIQEGADRNAALRADNPTAEFLANEIVVRVTFFPLGDCFHKDALPATENPLAKDFKAVSGCQALPETTGLPEDLQARQSSNNYGGMHLGNGLPPDTLLEVLIDPEDFLDELHL